MGGAQSSLLRPDSKVGNPAPAPEPGDALKGDTGIYRRQLAVNLVDRLPSMLSSLSRTAGSWRPPWTVGVTVGAWL